MGKSLVSCFFDSLCICIWCAQAKSQSFDVHGTNLGDMMNISFAPNISLQVCVLSALLTRC